MCSQLMNNSGPQEPQHVFFSLRSTVHTPDSKDTILSPLKKHRKLKFIWISSTSRHNDTQRPVDVELIILSTAQLADAERSCEDPCTNTQRSFLPLLHTHSVMHTYIRLSATLIILKGESRTEIWGYYRETETTPWDDMFIRASPAILSQCLPLKAAAHTAVAKSFENHTNINFQSSLLPHFLWCRFAYCKMFWREIRWIAINCKVPLWFSG